MVDLVKGRVSPDPYNLSAPSRQLAVLTRKWLADSPAAGTSGLQDSSFVECMQSLIKDLKRFNLSWLAACPLTGQKGNLGTGSWVGENFVFLAHVSPIVFAACPRDRKKVVECGLNNMSRMVICFHGLIARLMTHSGINEATMRETSWFIREFLSCVKEFNTRVQHKVHNTKTSTGKRHECCNGRGQNE